MVSSIDAGPPKQSFPGSHISMCLALLQKISRRVVRGPFLHRLSKTGFGTPFESVCRSQSILSWKYILYEGNSISDFQQVSRLPPGLLRHLSLE